MIFENIYLDGALAIFIFMNIGFIIAMLIRDNSIVDVLWGMGFVLVVWMVEIFYPGEQGKFLKLLVTIWGLRLSVYLFLRYLKKGEDYRYKAWKEEWGKYYFIRSYWQVYMLQGTVMFIVALPLMGITPNPIHLSLVQGLGIFIFLVGLFFEGVGDWQLSRFKSNPENQGKIMDKGLWKYTRHPNYFGDSLVWWGVFLYCLPNVPLWTIIGPITMTFFLLKISGVAMLERKYKGNSKYDDYIKRTSAFIPLPPGKS